MKIKRIVKFTHRHLFIQSPYKLAIRSINLIVIFYTPKI